MVQRIVDFLYTEFDHYSWVGIYRVDGDMLLLGPWRGEEATEHVLIPVGKGVCGAAAQSGKTEIVDDVTKDARYLACFLSTRSEIVVPIKRNGVVVGEIDIDSDSPGAFTQQDARLLEKVAEMLNQYL
ncbi:MAG: GAF domain-containing protein [Methanobacteriota archaeon]